MTEKEATYDDELSNIDVYCSKAVGTLTRLQDTAERITRWEEENSELQASLKSTRSALEQVQMKQRISRQELTKIETQVAHHREIVQMAENALPTLQKEKGLAVSQENYKQAGKIHQQIKAKNEQMVSFSFFLFCSLFISNFMLKKTKKSQNPWKHLKA